MQHLQIAGTPLILVYGLYVETYTDTMLKDIGYRKNYQKHSPKGDRDNPQPSP